jgi:hypothetical protein
MTNIVAFRPPQARPVPLLNLSYEPAEIVHVSWGPIVQQSRELTTATARNLHLRRQRREAWNAGMTRVNYYRAALDMEHAIGSVRRWGVPEARNHPKYDVDARSEILRRYRAAIGDQILRPASRLADVDWKRKQIGLATFKYCGMTDECAQRAISEDIAFLTAHPVKRAKCG